MVSILENNQQSIILLQNWLNHLSNGPLRGEIAVADVLPT
jgi:hypothetical protein